MTFQTDGVVQRRSMKMEDACGAPFLFSWMLVHLLEHPSFDPRRTMCIPLLDRHAISKIPILARIKNLIDGLKLGSIPSGPPTK